MALLNITGKESNVIYAKGDVCLRISPFDNYRLFTLYADWMNDDRKPLDLTNSQTLYIVFKSKKKEIRIPEYDTTYSSYEVDKVNGQVLFKISKKNAIDILSMESRQFYITRVHEYVDGYGNSVTASDEEVLYVGQWRDDTSLVDDYTSTIKALSQKLEERNNIILTLQASEAELMKQVVNYTSTIEELKSKNDELSSQMVTLEAENATLKQEGDTYTAEIMDKNATTLYIKSDKMYTEEEWAEIAKKGMNGESQT